MPGFVILSDDFWLIGPQFANYIDTDLRPDSVGVDELKPDALTSIDLRPVSGTVVSEQDEQQSRPTSIGARELKPVGKAYELRPTSLKVEEDN